jgi:hypothetical protein
VPPTLPPAQEGPILEDVALVRDEMANLVWGIESRVLLPDGTAVPGFEAAAETHADFERLGAAVPGSAAEPVAPLRYRLASAVPENWIPFVAAHTDGSTRDVHLQRAALPRVSTTHEVGYAAGHRPSGNGVTPSANRTSSGSAGRRPPAARVSA